LRDPSFRDGGGDRLLGCDLSVAIKRRCAPLRGGNPTGLSAESQIMYDSFEWQRRLDLDELQPSIVRLTKLQPLDQLHEDGRIPLEVIDRKGDRWIAAQRLK